MQKFDISKYRGRGNKVAMLCETDLQAECFLTFLDSIGRTWRSGSSYKDNTYFEEYNEGEGILYYFEDGTRGSVELAIDDVEMLVFDHYDWSKFGYKSKKRRNKTMSFDEMFFGQPSKSIK